MKMKKVMGTLAVGALAATLAIGGTLAYLTDREAEVNVFTVGDVSIDLSEDFEQGAQLLPGVDIEKEVAIENTGKNDAYVWFTYAVPTWSDNTETASKNIIHVNHPGAFWDQYYTQPNYINSAIEAGYLPEGSTGVDESDTWIIDNVEEKVEIDGKDYNLYTAFYKGAIEPGEITNIGMSKVYLDAHVDYNKNDGKYYWVEDGKATLIEGDIADYKIYVSAYGIQAEGFADVQAAYAAYGTQWGENGGVEYVEPTVAEVAAVTDMNDALKEYDVVVLNQNLTIDDLNNRPFMTTGNTFNGNGNTLKYTGGLNGKSSAGVLNTKGGKIVNVTVEGGENGCALYSTGLTSDLYVSDAVLDGAYSFNLNSSTATEYSIYFDNTVFKSWTSYSNAAKAVYFTGCTFEANLKPYTESVLVGCEFGENATLDLSSLKDGETITLEGCTYKGAPLTAENIASLVEAEYLEQIVIK